VKDLTYCPFLNNFLDVACEDNIKVDLTNGIGNFGLDAYRLRGI
jgi:hypothetical protein